MCQNSRVSLILDVVRVYYDQKKEKSLLTQVWGDFKVAFPEEACSGSALKVSLLVSFHEHF